MFPLNDTDPRQGAFLNSNVSEEKVNLLSSKYDTIA